MGAAVINLTCHATKIAEFSRKLPWVSLASSCGINALPSVIFLAFVILSSQGEYNGDGTNGITEYIVKVILFAFAFTPSVLAFATGAAYVSSRLFLCAKDKALPPTQLQTPVK